MVETEGHFTLNRPECLQIMCSINPSYIGLDCHKVIEHLTEVKAPRSFKDGDFSDAFK